MQEDLGHGPRLSDEEFERRIVDLHRGQAPMPSPAEDERLRRQELDLTIDHRLGLEYPLDRREQLWAVQQRVERKRLRLWLLCVVSSWIRDLRPRASIRLAQLVFREYARVLTPSELDSFLSKTPPGGFDHSLPE